MKTYHIRVAHTVPSPGPSPGGAAPSGTVVEVALEETPEGLRAGIVHRGRDLAGSAPTGADGMAGAGRAIDLAELMPRWYSLIIAGRSHTLGIATWRAGPADLVSAGPRHWALMFDGEAVAVGVTRSARGRLFASPRAIAEAEQVRAPMPGLVVAIQAGPGTAVAPGQPLIIMEAMKMQMEIRAPRAGVVREMRVAPGQDVAGNDVLATLE